MVKPLQMNHPGAPILLPLLVVVVSVVSPLAPHHSLRSRHFLVPWIVVV